MTPAFAGAGPTVVPVPCLRDNYAYLVCSPGSAEALAIDPSEAAPVRDKLAELGLELAAILSTHHHWDHVGGNDELCAEHPDLAVYAHRSDLEERRVPRQTVAVDHRVPFSVAGLDILPLHVPGHTLGAVSYCIGDAVFTGDTLFVAGCGRLFEGTPEMMHRSLCRELASLPGATRVYCGHEYTASNLRFALVVEPDNQAARDKLAWAEERQRQGAPTVPSTLAEELCHNPFLRCAEPALAERYGGGSPVEVFARVRAAKDVF